MTPEFVGENDTKWWKTANSAIFIRYFSWVSFDLNCNLSMNPVYTVLELTAM